MHWQISEQTVIVQKENILFCIHLRSFPALLHYFIHSCWTLGRSFKAITIVD